MPRLTVALASVLLLGAPRAALACPVCFGESDAPLAQAMNQGIIFMLGVVICVLGAFATFIVHLSRRARLAAGDHEPIGHRGLAGSTRSESWTVVRSKQDTVSPS